MPTSTKKKNEEAKKLYDNAAKLEKDPVRLSSSYNNLGTIFQDEQNYEKAIEAYKSALRSNPNHKNARYNLELCKRKLKQQQNQQSSDKNKSDKDKEKKRSNLKIRIKIKTIKKIIRRINNRKTTKA